MMSKNITKKKFYEDFFLSGKRLHWVLCLLLSFQTDIIQAEGTPDVVQNIENPTSFSVDNKDITIIGDVQIINHSIPPKESIKISIAEGAQLIDAHEEVKNYTLVTAKTQDTPKETLAKNKPLTKEKAVEPTTSEKKHNVYIDTLKPAPATTRLYALASDCHHSFVLPSHDYKKVAQNMAIIIMLDFRVLSQKTIFFVPDSKITPPLFSFSTRGPPQFA